MIEKIKENIKKAIENGNPNEAEKWLRILSEIIKYKDILK